MSDYETILFPSRTIKAVDHLVKLAKHTTPKGRVESPNDWRILKETILVWSKYYPEDFTQFTESAKQLKRAHQFNKGIAKGDGEALIQHQLEIPEKLYHMIMSMFPNQNFDKEFVQKFMKELPLFDVTKN